MKSTPEYNRQKIAVAFLASATTAVDTTLTEVNLIHSMLVVAHATPATICSAASGGIVKLIDSFGNVIKTFTEVLTGTTTLLSADIMVFPNDVLRYAVSVDSNNNMSSCASGKSVQVSELPTATVILYKY